MPTQNCDSQSEVRMLLLFGCCVLRRPRGVCERVNLWVRLCFFLLLVCLSDRHDLQVTSGQTVLL